jgi:putative ubiquitin-RnfH superfamily antitoxin RatB of RatAB toxin-antitoxin module
VAEPVIRVSVAYAERERQTLIDVELPVGATAAEAVRCSGIRDQHPGIAADAPLGIHGRRVEAGEVLADGDRVELYRPLPADPKETRRRLAREGRTMGERMGRRP